MKKYVFGVKIYVKGYTGAGDADIGLYADGSDGWFRWVENTVITADTWKSGYLVGIGKITQSADFKDGGNLAEVKGTEIQIANIDSTQTTSFWKKIETLGICLVGLTAEIVEFDASTSPAATETIIFRGVAAEAVNFNEATYAIPIRNTHYKRRVNLSTLIDNDPVNGNRKNADETINGTAIPVTFGKIEKAMFVKTANKINTFDVTDYFEITPANKSLYAFPVIEATANSVKIALADSIVSVISEIGSSLDEWIVHVIEGKGEGQYRKISGEVTRDGTSLTIPLSDYFLIQLSGNSTAMSNDNSWIEIIEAHSQYECDVWPCASFMGRDTLASTKPTDLYSYESEKTGKGTVEIADINTPTEIEVDVKEAPSRFFMLPDEAYRIEEGDTNYNRIVIDPKQFSDSLDKISAFRFIPIGSGKIKFFSGDISKYSISSDLNNMTSIGYLGSYRGGVTYPIFIPTPVSLTSYDCITDRDYLTNMLQEMRHQFNRVQTFNYSFVTTLIINELPDIPSDFDFDKIYIGVRLSTESNVNNLTQGYSMDSKILIRTRRFMGPASEILSTSGITFEDDAGAVSIDDIPDFYYLTHVPSTMNKNFYNDSTSGKFITGVANFEIDKVSDTEKYKNIETILIAIKKTIQYTPISIGDYLSTSVNNYECCVTLRKDLNISDNIFSGMYARIFNSTWGSRKNSDAVMNNPRDICEHILRLQNFSEVGDVVDYGKEYCENALINTASAEGGFDYAGLDILNSYSAAAQFSDYESCWSDALLKSLCQQYDLCIFQDGEGKECLNYIGSYKVTPAVSLGIGDIIEGSVGNVVEQHADSVFCEPVIYYNYNYGSDKFDNVIRITNSGQDTYTAGYVTGYRGDEAEELWNLANALWKRYRTINDPPEHLTHCEWIRQERDAKEYLHNWFKRMGVYIQEGEGIVFSPKKWISFSVPYELSMTIGDAHKPWFVSMHLLLNLPLQTNGQDVQCIIESVSFDIENNKTDVTAIIMDRTDEIDLYIQDSYDSYAAVGWADWEDDYNTQAEEPTNSYDIEDVY